MKQGTPEPRANAKEAHEPEPDPEKQRDELADGTRPTGQGDDGNETQQPPADATADTTATDRRAKEDRPTPKADAEKTRARGNWERKNSSTPPAQPTSTDADGDTNDAATDNAPRDTPDNDRDPLKPTQGKSAIETINSNLDYISILPCYTVKSKRKH